MVPFTPANLRCSLTKIERDNEPYSINDILGKAKQHGSALLSSDNDSVLLEVYKNKNGQWVFLASNATYDPKVIVEEKAEKGREIWEMQVTAYLQKHYSKKSKVTCEATHKRWKRNEFTHLENYYVKNGLLKKDRQHITLTLPNQKTLTFDGPYAKLKANIVLKHVYQYVESPIKHEESNVWDLVKKVFISYLYLSGQTLSPILKAATVSGVTFHANKNPALAIVSGLFATIDLVRASKTNSEAYTSTDLKRKIAPITITTPLPNMDVQPGVQLIQQINMKQYFDLADPTNYLELSMKLVNGDPVPSWLTLDRSKFTNPLNLFLGGAAQSICIEESYIYVALNNGIKIIDISDPNQPVVVGSRTNYAESYWAIAVKDKYVFAVDSTQIQIFDANDPSNIKLVSSLSGYNFPIIGNYIYSVQYSGGNCVVTIIDISNPSLPVVKTPKTLFTSTGYPCKAFDCSPYLCIYDKYLGLFDNLYMFDISQPENPISKSSIFINPYSIETNNNFLYIAEVSGDGNYVVNIYDITQVTNPVLEGSAFIDGTPSNMFIEGDYLYSFNSNLRGTTLLDGVVVLNIKDKNNPELIDMYATLDSLTGMVQSNTLYAANQAFGLTVLSDSNRVFSGIPASTDRGLSTIAVTATDRYGNTLVQQVAAHVGDINVNAIPDQMVLIGNPASLTLPLDTFEFPGATFAYVAQLVGGMPLPPFIQFNPQTRQFNFTPQSGDQNRYAIEVIGNDGTKNTSTTFQLVIPNHPPISQNLLEDQLAFSGILFDYSFGASSFSDLDNDTLTYTANVVGTSSLPIWLSFNSLERRFNGVPVSKNIFPIQVSAADGHGGIAASTFTLTIPNTAPVVLNSVNTQTATVGFPFSFTFNINTFDDIDNDSLTYSIDTLPPFLTFNPSARTIAGTPQGSDVGTYTISLEAKDNDGGNVSSSFNLNVMMTGNNPPVLVKPISDLTLKVGIPFNYTIDSGTFQDPEGQSIIYKAVLEGGNALPDGLSFNSQTQTLSGIFYTPQNFRISIIATDPQNAFAIDTFTLTLVDSKYHPPVVLNPLPSALATVGQDFYYHIPADTFSDQANNLLTISVTGKHGKPLSKWLKWDSKALTLTGKPGMWDTGTYQDKVVEIDVAASDGKTVVKTNFNIIVEGQSFWEQFINISISLGSVSVLLLGAWRNQAHFINFVKMKQYQKLDETAIIGEPFFRPLAVAEKQIKKIRILNNGNELIGFPEGLLLKDGKIEGTAAKQKEDCFTVIVYNRHDRIVEKFNLLIKELRSEKIPIEPSTYWRRFISLIPIKRGSKSQDMMRKSLLAEEIQAGDNDV